MAEIPPLARQSERPPLSHIAFGYAMAMAESESLTLEQRVHVAAAVMEVLADPAAPWHDFSMRVGLDWLAAHPGYDRAIDTEKRPLGATDLLRAAAEDREP